MDDPTRNVFCAHENSIRRAPSSGRQERSLFSECSA
jgi:hypothetical protein